MMFRCSECGCEFEQKPDFCDCGNNVFEEIVSEKSQKKSDYNSDVSKKSKKTFDEQYPELSNFMATLDPISVIIFIICIILSISSFIFIKPKERTEDEQKAVAQKVTHNVPDINTFWNDTPPKKEIKQIQIEETSNKDQTVNIIVKKAEEKPKVQVKPAVSSAKPQTVQKKSTSSSKKTSVQTNKKTSTTTKTQNKTANKPSQTTTKTQPAVQKSSSSSTPQTTVWQPSQQTVISPAPSTPSVSVSKTNQAEQELKTYKEGLRNTIGKRIDFTKVYGSGTCVVEFKVDSSGRLINRKFATQSTNNTLNDEVFNAVKSVPVYKAPPSSYNGQVMSLKVSFSNGHYSVSLK